MNRVYDSIAILIIAIIVSTVLYLFGVWTLSFAVIGSMITYMAALNSANDFVEVAFDKNAIGKVSRSYFNRMTLLLLFAAILLTTSANPIIVGIAALIINAL